MRIDLADMIKPGDKIYNCFMEPLIVTSIYKDVMKQKIIFSTLDTRLNRAGYSYTDAYLEDLEGESDDEKSWINWATNNNDILSGVDDIETCKEFYKIGFCQGFEFKRKITAQEALQK